MNQLKSTNSPVILIADDDRDILSITALPSFSIQTRQPQALASRGPTGVPTLYPITDFLFPLPLLTSEIPQKTVLPFTFTCFISLFPVPSAAVPHAVQAEVLPPELSYRSLRA